jgi:hypothetical protein|nr:MAG TPA: Protein of unknown function (DUF1642) [Caudoviricetes sp.]
MTTQELIEKINKIAIETPFPNSKIVDHLEVIKLIEQLEEPQKVKIPQFVADWIEVCKEHLTHSLYTAMTPNFMKENGQSLDLILWIKKASNQDIFARAWLDGYEVEKEKRYLVSLKNGQPLVRAPLRKNFYFNQNITAGKYKATRKELEEAGFGWVFDCEGIEIEEVTE